MTFGLVNASFSLPEWQAVEMTFFAHCNGKKVRSLFSQTESNVSIRWPM